MNQPSPRSSSAASEWQHEFLQAEKEKITRFLSEFNGKTLATLFQRYDTQGSGFMNIHDFRQLCQDIFGSSLKNGQVEELLQQHSPNKDGKIGWLEFLNVLATVFTKEEHQGRLRVLEAFKQCDLNGSGRIEFPAFYQLLSLLFGTCHVPAPVLQALFTQADADRDGRLNFQEVVNLVDRLIGNNSSHTPSSFLYPGLSPFSQYSLPPLPLPLNPVFSPYVPPRLPFPGFYSAGPLLPARL
eukprot:g21443.t1